MSFSQDAWKRNLKLYQSTLNLPFNQQLASGKLSKSVFSYYLIQDGHYLLAYSRVLAICAAKAHEARDVLQFAQRAQDAIVVERSLHTEFMAYFNVNKEEFENASLSLASHHYISHLTSIAWSESYPVVLASLLPCFRISAEISRDISSKSTRGNPYQAWIDTYASEEFHHTLNQIIHTIDQIAAHSDETTIARMHEAYQMTCKLEWLFWESAYQMQQWGTTLDHLFQAKSPEKVHHLYHI